MVSLLRWGDSGLSPSSDEHRIVMPLWIRFQHPQRQKGVPPAGLAWLLHSEMHFPCTCGLKRPTAVASSLRHQDAERVRHSIVPPRFCSTKVVQAAEDVIEPARWERQLQKISSNSLARAIRFIQAVQQNKLARCDSRSLKLSEPVTVAIVRVFLDTLEYGKGGMQRAMAGARAVTSAVKSAIRHMLGEQEIDNRTQLVSRHSEIAGVVEHHSVHANVALLACVRAEYPAIVSFELGKNVANALTDQRMTRGDAKRFEIKQRVVRTCPLRLIEPLTPGPISIAAAQKSCSPSVGRNARTDIGPFLVKEIPMRLIFDSGVALEEPLDDCCIVHSKIIALLKLTVPLNQSTG